MYSLKSILLQVSLLLFTFLNCNTLQAQCAAGEVEITLNTGGGTTNDIWVNITTGANGTGTVIWAQGNGSIGNGEGALTDQVICVPTDVDLYINAFDQYDNSWQGSTYTITQEGMVIVNNGGAAPDDGSDNDGSSSWQSGVTDLETSEVFQVSTVEDVTTIDDLCEDDERFTISPITANNPDSGYCGVAIFLITPDDVSNSTVDFSIQDFDGNYFYNETNIVNLQPNSLYVLYDNPCFDITDAGSTPEFLWITDDIPQESSTIQGCGYYIYYYAHDAIEVFNNRSSTYVSGDPSTYQGYYYDPSDPQNLGNVPAFYTTNTWKRTETIWTTGSKKIIMPDPATYQYYSHGEWTGTGVTSTGTASKSYWAGFPSLDGLIRTVDYPSGHAEIDPSAMPIGANNTLTFTYNSVMGVAGPAPCNTTTVTTHEIDVHALPEVTDAINTDCSGPTYDVTIDIDLDNYNISVDEDGGTPFTINATGGTPSTATLTGTGTQQVTISGIPSGSPWSLDVTDPTGLTCGLTGANGTCISLLPVELVDLHARQFDQQNLITWTTLSEDNNAYFEVQKSLDGENFTPMHGWVNGAGNSQAELNYSKLDGTPYQTTYYRLKQVDYDGAFEYSETVVVERQLSTNGDLTLYPNPAANTVVISSNAIKNQVVRLECIDLTGKLVYAQTVNQNNNGVLKIDISSLKAGAYTVVLNTATEVLRERLVKR